MTAIVPGSKRRASGEPAASVVTLYMEGLPYTSTEDDIRSFFDVAPLDIRAPKYQDSGRLMGYAHVDFGTAADVEAALAKDGNYLGGRFISVLRAKPSSSSGDANMAYSTTTRPASCTTLFVKGLPYDADEDTVKSAFSRFGSVASVRLGRWNHTARLKGFGYVQFEHGTSAEAAVKAYRATVSGGAPVKVGGRTVHLDYETGAPKQSFKTSSGQSFFKTEEAAAVKSTPAWKAAHRPKAEEAEESKPAAGAGGAAMAVKTKKKREEKDKKKKRDGGDSKTPHAGASKPAKRSRKATASDDE